MCLPITAVGPLNVLTNPIFTEFCAAAGTTWNASAQPMQIAIFFIVCPPLWLFPAANRPHRGGRCVVFPGNFVCLGRLLEYTAGSAQASATRKRLLEAEESAFSPILLGAPMALVKSL